MWLESDKNEMVRKFHKETKLPSHYNLYPVLQVFEWNIEHALQTFNADPNGFRQNIEPLNEPGCSADKLGQMFAQTSIGVTTGKLNFFADIMLLPLQIPCQIL